MSSERLEDLIEISCERDISYSITLDRMVEAFKLAGEAKVKTITTHSKYSLVLDLNPSPH